MLFFGGITEALSEEKVRLLIITKSLVFNKENMLYIENHFKDLCLEFVRQNIEEYLNAPELYDLDAKELLTLYNNYDIEISIKVKLSALVEEADFSAEPNLVASVTSCILDADNISHLNTGVVTSLLSLHKNLKDKKNILTKTMSLISKEDIIEGLRAISDGYEKLLVGKHPKIKNNKEDALLLEALKKKEIVSSFELINGKYEARPKRNLL